MLADYVVQTHHNQERTVHDEIDLLGYQSTWLTVREEYRTKLGRQFHIVSLFPCYVFVRFDIDNHNWEEITKCRGVKNILGSSPIDPKPLRHGAVWELKQRFEAIEFKPVIEFKSSEAPSRPLIVGEKVIVEAGASEVKIGTVCRISKEDRIRIMTTYFGSEREIEVSAHRVRPYIEAS